jgi:hypothetical protein
MHNEITAASPQIIKGHPIQPSSDRPRIDAEEHDRSGGGEEDTAQDSGKSIRVKRL